jgi:ketopantoate reductase
MVEEATRRVLVVGAFAAGVAYRYILSLAGIEITFLVRPHRTEALSKLQTLYRYNGHQLKAFSEHKVITDSNKMGDVLYVYPHHA